MQPDEKKEKLRARLFEEDEPDFWPVFHEMNHRADKMKGEAGAFVRGALWAVGWTANTQGYQQVSALRKLWEQYFD